MAPPLILVQVLVAVLRTLHGVLIHLMAIAGRDKMIHIILVVAVLGLTTMVEMVDGMRGIVTLSYILFAIHRMDCGGHRWMDRRRRMMLNEWRKVRMKGMHWIRMIMMAMAMAMALDLR